jgi:hypothetical protein
MSKKYHKALCIIVLGGLSFIGCSSFLYPHKPEPLIYPVFIDYNEKEFYQDAFDYRFMSKIQKTEYYYQKAVVTPIVIAPKIAQPIEEIDKGIPDWILRGILKHETQSYYDENGNIVYVNRARGSCGEIGPFQMRLICFNQIKKRGDSFYKMQNDVYYAEKMATKYLLYLYNGPANKSWQKAIGMYNTGPTGYTRLMSIANKYFQEVKQKSKE